MGQVFSIIPVLDVLNGRAVHARGGERSGYRPVRSILHPGHDPRELARSFRDTLGLSTLYLADLDAIIRRGENSRLYGELAELGLELLVDAGVRDDHDPAPLLAVGGLNVVAGLETLEKLESIGRLLDRVGPDRLIVSIDLRNGRPITSTRESWGRDSASAIAGGIVATGVRRLILLDLAKVGTGSGTGTDELLATLISAQPDLEVIVGGGASGMGDVFRARELGASAVLVGSALHDGRIDRAAIESLGG